MEAMSDLRRGHVCLFKVTDDDLKQCRLQVSARDGFFPADCLISSEKAAAEAVVEIHLDGLDSTVAAEIEGDREGGFHQRSLVVRGRLKRFFEHHRIRAGDILALKRIADRQYRLFVGPATRPRLTACEFFAGIGLVRLALERQGWDVVFANDIDPKKAEMYLQNWPSDQQLVIGDIHDLKAEDLPESTLFTASFPCNDLSLAGRWEGLHGKESSAFWGLVRLIRDLGARRPALILLENVVGFLLSRGGKDFEIALSALNELGYAVDAIILNAVHWVPQSRPRLFVIAQQDGGDDRRSCSLISDVRPKSLFRFISAHPHIRWNIRDLPKLPLPCARLADIIENLPDDDPHWWSSERADYFMSQLSAKHRERAQRMIEGMEYSYATAFRRVRHGRSMAELRNDDIAGCLRTPRGGSGRQIVLKAGRGRYQVRLLTARECARLQGVPDSYVINVPLNQALFGFGDAVCVPAVEWIAQHYLTPLAASLTSKQIHDLGSDYGC